MFSSDQKPWALVGLQIETNPSKPNTALLRLSNGTKSVTFVLTRDSMASLGAELVKASGPEGAKDIFRAIGGPSKRPQKPGKSNEASITADGSRPLSIGFE